jgi:hypothetical protein
MGDAPDRARVLPKCAVAFSSEEHDAILLQVGRIVDNAPFRRSPRCQEFLKYIIEQTIKGRLDLLKERAIGLTLFGRSADYETGVDSIVRVRANDVRKRLAQFYLEYADQPVEIQLPVGSYVPEIHFRKAAPAEVLPPVDSASQTGVPQRWQRLIWGLIAMCLLGAGGYLAGIAIPHRTPLDEFWSPVASSGQTPLIWSSAGSFLRLESEILEQLRESKGDAMDLHIRSGRVRILDRYVSPGNLYSIVSISQLLTKMGRAPDYRLSGEITIAEQSNRPLILLGIYSNPWTMELNRDWRFRFSAESPHEIVDTRHPGRSWRPREAADKGDTKAGLNYGNVTQDYALITRMFRPGSRQVVITAGGLIHFGTQAAAEFLTNPVYWNEAVAKFPKDWPSRNLQLVIETRVVNQTPNPPKLVEVYCW